MRLSPLGPMVPETIQNRSARHFTPRNQTRWRLPQRQVFTQDIPINLKKILTLWLKPVQIVPELLVSRNIDPEPLVPFSFIPGTIALIPDVILPNLTRHNNESRTQVTSSNKD
jgi:hypothetical protein